MAEKTGRSGQPTQKPGGRSGNGPPSRRLRLGAAGACRLEALARTSQRSMSLADGAKNFSSPSVDHLGGVLARHRQHVLAVDLGVDVALAQDGVIACSM